MSLVFRYFTIDIFLYMNYFLLRTHASSIWGFMSSTNFVKFWTITSLNIISLLLSLFSPYRIPLISMLDFLILSSLFLKFSHIFQIFISFYWIIISLDLPSSLAFLTFLLWIEFLHTFISTYISHCNIIIFYKLISPLDYKLLEGRAVTYSPTHLCNPND